MRIKRLKIEAFKNLQNFEIDFDDDRFTSVVVGHNGTGKSNLLEALVLIFSELLLQNTTPPFRYELEYSCRDHNIIIDADPGRQTRRLSPYVDGRRVTLDDFLGDPNRYLPRYVFGYYSGPSNRLESHFRGHQRKFYNDLLKGADVPFRPLLYARHVHSQFVLLAFFRESDIDVDDFLSRHLRIESFDSALFVLGEPSWRSDQGDGRFWNARGYVRDFLDVLYAHAMVPMRLNQRAESGLSSTNEEHLFLYLPDRERLLKVADGYDSPQDFFKALESTYISDLIREVRIRVRIRNLDGSLTFHELSEGEQQLLTVLGLLKFTRENESLFLLDEPDTHLNPAWSMQYLDLLEEVVGDQQTSQIIMTTHDPIVLANLYREQVRILRFEEGTDRILVETPEEDPYYMGYPEILTSDLFGLRSIINPTLLQLLDEKRSLSILEELTSEQQEKLAELNKEIQRFDFTSTVRDPLYKPFVEAMAEAEAESGLQKPVLTEVQREERLRLAREMLQRVLAKRNLDE